jgi:DNA-binding PadR family transcriptional regulator
MPKNELISLALIFSEPRHAYALNAIIKEMELEHWAHISQASIYNALNRLEHAQCVKVTTERVGNNPERRVYHITDAGKERLRQELREALLATEPCDNPFYLAANFAIGLQAEELLRLLEERVERLRDVLSHLSEQLLHVREHQSEPAALMLEAGMRHVEVEIALAGRLVDLVRGNPHWYEQKLPEQLREIEQESQ